MIRFALTLALSLSAGVVDAQSVKLRGDEIGILLTGNTAVGVWEGTSYRQFFDTDGTTIYAEQGARAARGEWRIEGEEYQSRWPEETDWEGWFVMEYAGDWYWVSKSTPPTPFKVLQGDQLVAK